MFLHGMHAKCWELLIFFLLDVESGKFEVTETLDHLYAVHRNCEAAILITLGDKRSYEAQCFFTPLPLLSTDRYNCCVFRPKLSHRRSSELS